MKACLHGFLLGTCTICGALEHDAVPLFDSGWITDAETSVPIRTTKKPRRSAIGRGAFG